MKYADVLGYYEVMEYRGQKVYYDIFTSEVLIERVSPSPNLHGLGIEIENLEKPTDEDRHGLIQDGLVEKVLTTIERLKWKDGKD